MKKMNKKGFTIVELVIVIAVIAILAAVLIPTFSNVIQKANKSAQMQEVKNALTNYMANIADSGETIQAGLVFCYDEDNKADTLTDRTYFAYVNQGLQEIDPANITKISNIKNGDNKAVAGIRYGAAATAADLDKCYVYTVNVNGSNWYGVILDTGVQGYGASGANKTESDKIFVCTGFIAVEGEETGTWQAKAAAVLGAKTLLAHQFEITWAT
ncbi:MAG: type II secretion system GspH family protein [Clostridia bacterium]|nr:type II secretion system GspH family protein [Clostridia bacterium]